MKNDDVATVLLAMVFLTLINVLFVNMRIGELEKALISKEEICNEDKRSVSIP